LLRHPEITRRFAIYHGAYVPPPERVQALRRHLAGNDAHILTAEYDSDVRKTVISSFFVTLTALEREKKEHISRSPPSALLEATKAGKASVYAFFGGQGTNEVYSDELQHLCNTYKAFVTTMTKDMLQQLSEARNDIMLLDFGMNVHGWFAGTIPRPPLPYLASVPVSLPLISLTQLASRATGHSQGIIFAVAISASTSFESLALTSYKAVKWLLCAGCRAQQAFLVLSLEPSIVKDSVDGGEIYHRPIAEGS
jgi:fatty acid synthase subunit beta